MQTILEALAKFRAPAAVRSVAVDHDEKTDEYTVTIRIRKASGHDAVAVYRIGYRDAMTVPVQALAYRLIEAANAAWAAPEPPPAPEPARPEPPRPHHPPKKHLPG